MKTLKFSLLALSVSLMSFSIIPVSTQSVIATSISSAISWKSDAVDVGTIPQGTPKVINFEFKNTGDKSIFITNVKPSCGCTAADYSKEPIAPKQLGFVKATYNAAAMGTFSKTVTVTINIDDAAKTLTFKGIVVAK